MRRRAILQRLQEKSKARAGLIFGHAESMEDLALNILAMNTNGTRSQLGAVEHHVIGERAHRRRIRLQLIHVMLVRRSKRMVRGGPALALLVPFEHGEIGDPEEAEVFGGVASLFE